MKHIMTNLITALYKVNYTLKMFIMLLMMMESIMLYNAILYHNYHIV